MTRTAGGALAALALLLLVAAPVAAGGWATITPDTTDKADAEPVAGELIEIGFTVLQHGQTPAPWAHAAVVASNSLTGATVRAAATSTGSDGHFAASLTLPEAGLWTWAVEITDLENASAPVPLAVRTVDGTLPALEAAMVLQLLEQAKTDVRAELRGEYLPRLEDLGTQASARQSETRTLDTRLDKVLAERDALQARLVGLEAGGSGSIPVIGVATIAALAGAVAAFLMIALARSRPQGSAPSDEAARPEYAPTR